MKKSILSLYVICGFWLVCFLSGCQTPVEVDLPDYGSKLVIEGTIENGQPAMVIVSKSIPYFSDIDLNYLADSVFVTDAVVTVTSSAGETEQLTMQYCADSPLYFAYRSSQIKGRENTSYTLKVEYHGKIYTAVTTIPHTFELDSIWFDNSVELLTDSMRSIRILMTDDPAVNNYYGFSVKVQCPTLHDRLWVHCLPLAFDDQTFSGLTFNYEITRSGVSSFLLPEMTEEERKNYFRMTYRPGDTVYVKHSLMDYNTYRFMITGGVDAVYGSNPFTNPAPVVSNIVGEDVLGSWCGFASSVDTLIWSSDRHRKR